MRQKGESVFTDPDFGPQEKDDLAQDSLYFEDIPTGYPLPKNMRWLRLNQISQKKRPEFIDDGAGTNDVIQGALGDCWFIGALSVLATEDAFIRGSFDPEKNTDDQISNYEAKGMTSGVYPPMFHYLRKYGMYVFRFFKNYKWRYVIIDDRLPCYKRGYGEPDIVFGKCRSQNEFWVPLIEKAYAKIHNCYEALISGFIDDGLADMTALAQTKIIFRKKGSRKIKVNRKLPGEAKEVFLERQRNDLWKVLMDGRKQHNMMGCSAFGGTELEIQQPEGKPCGILAGHAYSIIDVIDIEVKILGEDGEYTEKCQRLIRLRNPWGKKEWNGAFSDGSDELTDNLKALNTYVRKENTQFNDDIEFFSDDANDGTFLMPYEDWL